MQPYKMDLHIHTALSPCADKEMTPPKIIHAAKAKGLNMIAITDHNTAENAAATIQAAQGSGIFVIPGMEVQTREEVHMICLFPTLEACLVWQGKVYGHLPKKPNRPDVFGPQLLMNSSGEVTGELDTMLLVSTDMSVEEVFKQVVELNGLCIPAHVDRPSFSLMANLGFVPPELPVSTLELSRHTSEDEARILFSSLINYTLLSSSDAHSLPDIGENPTTIYCPAPPDFTELQKSLIKNSERKLVAKMKDLSMHLMDIMQNSVEAGATAVRLTIVEDTAGDRFTIEISDNGRGMNEKVIAKVIDPFYTTRKTRRVGLGLPLLKSAAERCEGTMSITSSPGQGTSVSASFRHSHIDRAPLGNIVDTIVNFVVGNPNLNLYFLHKIDDKEVIFDAAELKEQLEDVPLNNPAVLNWIKKYLADSYAQVIIKT